MIRCILNVSHRYRMSDLQIEAELLARELADVDKDELNPIYFCRGMELCPHECPWCCGCGACPKMLRYACTLYYKFIDIGSY